jgi:hypothetical protein
MNRINALHNSYPVDSKKYSFNHLPKTGSGTATANLPTGDRATISAEAMWLATMPSNPAEAEILSLNPPAQLVYNRRSLGLRRPLSLTG